MFAALQQRPAFPHDRQLAAGLSIALHAAAFLALVRAPAVRMPSPSESEYRQAFAGREEKIVWYKFRRELPAVSPPKAPSSKEPLRAQNSFEQTVMSSLPNAPKRPRMVWSSAPPLHDPAPLRSPNVIAVKLPPPPPKQFQAPETRRYAPAQAIKLLDAAPELAAFAMQRARAPEIRLAPKPFQLQPAPKRAAPHVIDAPAPPEIVVLATRPAASLEVKLAAKPFVLRARQVSRSSAAPALAKDAPVLAAAIPAVAPMNSPMLPPKPFAAPPVWGATRPVLQPHLAETSPPVLETSSKNLNLAMVGLNPADRALAPPPASPADFSAGRHLRQHGASAQPNTGVLSVPGLFVGKSHENSRPELIAEAFDPPTSKASIRAAINSVHMGSALSSGDNPMPSSAGAVHVTNAPEPRLEGRDVFMMAIQMPNLTSYSGSWLMWYADRTQKQAGLAPVAPPVPHRKVDPKYIASAVAERVEGQVRLACVITKQGTVGGVELLRGIDGRLNQSAEEALAKWEFYPATRNGQPVDVDVVVEIPFRLEPLAPKP